VQIDEVLGTQQVPRGRREDHVFRILRWRPSTPRSSAVRLPDQLADFAQSTANGAPGARRVLERARIT
jgi:hypothetical protein